MVLALASTWRRTAMAGVSLLALGACGTDAVTEKAPEAPPAIDRSDRVVGELARGQQALSSGDLATAQAAFTAALRGSPNDPEPALGLAETYLALGDFQTAERLFDLIASSGTGPDEARLLQGRGLVALGQGKTDEAIRLLERSVDRNPAQWRAWAGLGRAYGRLGKSHQAHAAFAHAEDVAPTPALVINDVGMLHLEEKEPAAALEAFQRALALDPANETANANARIARAMLRDYDAAVAGATPEELPDVLNNVGYIAIVNGDFDVADRLLRRAVDVSPVYHEAASANLDLLAQARRGVPVLAMAGPGVSPSRATADTELSSVAGDASERDGVGDAAAGNVVEVARGGAPERSAQGRDALAKPAGAPAVEIAAASQPPALATAFGFRWESPPVIDKVARKRTRKPAPPPATGNGDAGDPRTAAWPSIALPAEPGAPDAAQAAAPDAVNEPAPGEGTGAATPQYPTAPAPQAAAEVATPKPASDAAAPDAAARSGNGTDTGSEPDVGAGPTDGLRRPAPERPDGWQAAIAGPDHEPARPVLGPAASEAAAVGADEPALPR